jgi:hypothetical protein
MMYSTLTSILINILKEFDEDDLFFSEVEIRVKKFAVFV